jgi:hypothetical protein
VSEEPLGSVHTLPCSMIRGTHGVAVKSHPVKWTPHACVPWLVPNELFLSYCIQSPRCILADTACLGAAGHLCNTQEAWCWFRSLIFSILGSKESAGHWWGRSAHPQTREERRPSPTVAGGITDCPSERLRV